MRTLNEEHVCVRTGATVSVYACEININNKIRRCAGCEVGEKCIGIADKINAENDAIIRKLWPRKNTYSRKQ